MTTGIAHALDLLRQVRPLLLVVNVNAGQEARRAQDHLANARRLLAERYATAEEVEEDAQEALAAVSWAAHAQAALDALAAALEALEAAQAVDMVAERLEGRAEALDALADYAEAAPEVRANTAAEEARQRAAMWRQEAQETRRRPALLAALAAERQEGQA